MAAVAISCFAAAFAVPFTGTALIACLPLFFAVSTPAWFVALSILLFAWVAAASTAFLAVCFSSAVKPVFESIADFFMLAAFVIACFAAVRSTPNLCRSASSLFQSLCLINRWSLGTFITAMSLLFPSITFSFAPAVLTSNCRVTRAAVG